VEVCTDSRLCDPGDGLASSCLCCSACSSNVRWQDCQPLWHPQGELHPCIEQYPSRSRLRWHSALDEPYLASVWSQRPLPIFFLPCSASLHAGQMLDRENSHQVDRHLESPRHGLLRRWHHQPFTSYIERSPPRSRALRPGGPRWLSVRPVLTRCSHPVACHRLGLESSTTPGEHYSLRELGPNPYLINLATLQLGALAYHHPQRFWLSSC